MTLDDYVISLLLIALVFRQIRGRKLTVFGLLWPVGLVLIAMIEYFHSVPTQGNDVVLIGLTTTMGIILGLLCAVTTKVFRNSEGTIIGKATGIAALFWICGIGARLGFGLFAENGGASTIAQVSTQFSITSEDAWVTALLFMSLAEVLGRTIVLAVRAQRLKRA